MQQSCRTAAHTLENQHRQPADLGRSPLLLKNRQKVVRMADIPSHLPDTERSVPQFYTDDIILMPTTAILRVIRRQPFLLRVVLLPYFLTRKLLGLRHRANYGSSRPTQLPAVSVDELPPEVTQAFSSFSAVCTEHKMEHLRCVRSPSIGKKTAFTSFWMGQNGTTYANITWIEIRIGRAQKTKTVFACHSLLHSGVELHNAAMNAADWIPELIQPNQDFVVLPADTQASDVIAAHRKRLSSRSDVREFDADSILQQILRSSQEVFDFMLAKGIYSPLSQAETEQLISANQAMHRNGGGGLA